MANFCTQCGAPIPEGTYVCPSCGSVIPPAPQKKLKWWMIVIPVLLVAVILVVFLWMPLLLWIAPEAALAAAAARTGNDLAERYDGSPCKMMLDAFDPEGQGKVSLHMDTLSDIYSISYDFDLEYDNLTRQVALDFLMDAEGKKLDGSLYMDSECAAIGSDAVFSGEKYGITYETFSQDIRGNNLFSILDEETISQLEEIVETLQSSMQNDQEQRETTSEACREIASHFAQELEPTVGKSVLMLDGKNHSCYTISYTVTGDQLADFLSQIVDEMGADEAMHALYESDVLQNNPDVVRSAVQTVRDEVAESSVIFYIYRNYLVNIQSVTTGVDDDGTEMAVFELYFGTDASVDDLRLKVASGDQGTVISLATKKLESSYSEVITLQSTGETSETITLSYSWDTLSGNMMIQFQDADSQHSISLHLIELEEGFALSLDNFYEVLAGIEGEEFDSGENTRMPMTLTLKKGSAIQRPTFKNIDAWIISDFYSIFGTVISEVF